MRGGYAEALRRRPNRATYCDLLVRKAEDVRATKAEYLAGLLTDVTALDTGGVRLTATPAVSAEWTTSSGFVDDLFPDAAPGSVFIWDMASSIGPLARLSSLRLYVTRKADGGQPTFDGDFGIQLYTIGRYRAVGNLDLWEPVMVTDLITVAASSMTSDTELVTFTFPEPVPVGALGVPFLEDDSADANLPLTGRVVIATLRAFPVSNSNFGLGVDTAADPDEAVAGGTLRHRLLAFPGGTRPSWWEVQAATGMIRGAFRIDDYPATGSAVFEGAQVVTTGLAQQGDLEFVVRGETPTGTTLQAFARVGGADPWVEVKDGQSPADVGLTVPNPVAYRMKWELAANANGDSSPTAREIGILDRLRFLLNGPTENGARLHGFEERVVDVATGQVTIAEGRCFLQRDGIRDYRDLGTRLLSEYDPVDLQLRVFCGHPDVPRDQWLHLNTYLVDDYRAHETELELICVDVKEQCKGTFPEPSGTLNGYVLKAATAHVTAGSHTADFNRELSADTETAGAIVVSVAASATEDSRGVTPLGAPSIPTWPTGDWTVKVDVTAANTNLHLSIGLALLNSAGSDVALSPFTAEQQLTATGVKTFLLNNVSWPVGQAAHLLGVVYRFRNAAGSIQAVTIATGTLNTEVIPPWLGTQEIVPKEYFDEVADVYADWRDGVIGLAERYRGDLPTSTELVRKSVADVDGLEELQRLAFVATPQAGVVIASQGRLSFRSIYGPKSVLLDRMPVVPLEENASDEPLSPGLAGRVPELDVPYKWNQNRADEFAEVRRLVHTEALAAFGRSRIEQPQRRLEDETAKWLWDSGHAQRVGRPIIQALAWGKTILPVRSTVPYPEAEIGDPVAFETDTYVRRNPISGEPIRGLLWVVGVIVGVLEGFEGHAFDGTHFLVWLRNPGDFFRLTESVHRRQPFELPVVEIAVESHPSQPGNAVIRLRVFPDDADVYWLYHDGSVTTPPRDDPRWTLWDGADITVARDATATKVFSAYGVQGGFQGQQAWRAVAPDKSPVIALLVGTESGTSPNITVTVTATPDANVREILWLLRVHATLWPTADGSETGVIGQTEIAAYMVNRRGVIALGVGWDATGVAKAGGVTVQSTGRTTGDIVRVIAVPIDHTGLAREASRKTLAYTVTNTASPSLLPFTFTVSQDGTDCGAGNTREYDFAWTSNAAVVNATHDLLLYITVNGVRSLFATVTTPEDDALADEPFAAYETASLLDPEFDISFDYELKAGAAVIEAGPVSLGMVDVFFGQAC